MVSGSKIPQSKVERIDIPIHSGIMLLLLLHRFPAPSCLAHSPFKFTLAALSAPPVVSHTSLPQERASIHEQPRRRQHAQSRWKRLPSPNRARDGASCKEDGRQEREFHAVGLAFRDAVAAEAVLGQVSVCEV